VRGSLAITFVLSLGVHVAVAAALLVPEVPERRTAEELADPSPQLAGETFELPAPDTEDVPLANASPSPDENAAAAAAEPGDAPARPQAPPRARPGERPSRAGRPSAGRADPGRADGTPTGGQARLYGAVGDRSAADLATAFTRGFPQAASADPVWRTAPLGSAGEADVVITLDESGHIADVQVLGAPSTALARGIRRTLALVKGRPFVAKSKTTRLHLRASVSADSVHDGLHGDVFAIGGSFAGAEGNAFFALAIGRRIDLRVRVR